MMKCASMELCKHTALPCCGTHVCPSCNLNVHAMCGEICEEASLKFRTTCFKCFDIYGIAFADPAAAVREGSQKPAAKTCSAVVREHSLHENAGVSDNETYIPQETHLKVLKEIDEDIRKLKERPWKAVLPFHGFINYTGDEIPHGGDDAYNKKVDLFHFVRNLALTGLARIRFDPSIYNVRDGWDKKGDGQKLITALCNASKEEGGCELKCNGGKKKGTNVKVLFCPRHRQYDSQSIARKAIKKGKPEPPGPTRMKTFHCDKENSRGIKGLSMKKRTDTSRALNGDDTCKVKVHLDYDDKTYFIKCGVGQGTHTKHLPLMSSEISVRAKFVDDSMKEFQKKMAIANVEPGKSRAALHSFFGTSLTRRQVAYHQGFAKLADSLEDCLEIEKRGETSSDLDIFIEMLKKKGAAYCAIYHRSKSEKGCALELPGPKGRHEANSLDDVILTETGGITNADVVICETGNDTVGLGKDIIKYARESRVAVNASNEQDVLLALVWVLPEMKQLFCAYPEVIFIDGTHKTNYEGRPLITMGVKNSKGNMQIILRAFVPNERTWLFRWLFQVATPSLLGYRACEKVRLVITDGDSQETSQLDEALKTVFKTSKRRRCGWHIIDRGWERIVRSIGRTDVAKNIESIIKYWLYSMMKNIETAEEYEISKALLVKYVQSETVSRCIGWDKCESLLQFLRNNVFPYEDHFAGHHYCYTFSFDEYSNTALEGTNNGLKHNAHAVLPSMSIAKAGKCMINQDETKSNHRKRKASSEFNTQPLYTDTETSRYINDVAEEMLKEQIKLSHNYSSMQKSEKEWLVRFTAETSGPEVRSSAEWTVPVFERVRKVYLNNDGGLECTCGYTTRNGIPDRHIIHVAMAYGKNFLGFTHHNVHIRFWKAFDKFVAEGVVKEMQSREHNIREKLQKARFSPRLIVNVPNGFPPFEEGQQFRISKNSSENLKNMDEDMLREYFSANTHISMVKNYDKILIARAVGEMTGMSSVHSIGLSQEMYTNDWGGDMEGTSDFSEQNNMSFLNWQSEEGLMKRSSQQILFPRLKELASVYDYQPAEKVREVAAVLDDLIQKGKRENAAMQQKEPVGHLVSAVARNMHQRKKKQAKQIRHA